MNFDFRHIGILCVDDSGFLRGLMTDCLKALRIGHVHVAEDGKKAADILRRRAQDPALSQSHPIDIVISNWQMAGGDGLSFLNWVRTDAASPDRFMPFLLFTAFTDIEHVSRARDAGVDDIIAKPFSMKTVRDKISMLMARDMVFIESSTYFGPDRRHQALDFGSNERRMLTEQHDTVQVIHALPPDSDSPADRIRVYRLPNSLRDRASLRSGSGEEQKAAAAVQLQQAEKILHDFSDRYPKQAEDQVLELLSLRRSISERDVTTVTQAQTAKMLDGIKSITHDLIGQGSTFGFPLVTRAAKSLNMLAAKMTQLDSRKSELIQTHIRLLQLILQEKRAGEDHPQVRDAIVGLEIAVNKCLA